MPSLEQLEQSSPLSQTTLQKTLISPSRHLHTGSFYVRPHQNKKPFKSTAGHNQNPKRLFNTYEFQHEYLKNRQLSKDGAPLNTHSGLTAFRRKNRETDALSNATPYQRRNMSGEREYVWMKNEFKDPEFLKGFRSQIRNVKPLKTTKITSDLFEKEVKLQAPLFSKLSEEKYFKKFDNRIQHKKPFNASFSEKKINEPLSSTTYEEFEKHLSSPYELSDKIPSYRPVCDHNHYPFHVHKPVNYTTIGTQSLNTMHSVKSPEKICSHEGKNHHYHIPPLSAHLR